MLFTHKVNATAVSHWCTCASLLPPHLVPLGCPSVPALRALFHGLNLNWSSISRMVIYKLQCSSLKSSHPHLLPQTPKVWFSRLCRFCCLAYRAVVTIFLNPYIRTAAAAAAKSLQSCDPIDGSPPGSPVPGILQARTLAWGAIVSMLYWCFSFWVTSLCMIDSSFIHLIRTDSNAFFLTDE